MLISPVSARWANIEDTDVSVEFHNQNFYVRKDGTYTVTTEMMLKPLKESGKDSLVSYPLVYNAVSSKLNILEAKVLLQGKEYPVDPKQIEDKPLASSPKGFDQNNQILLAFPQVSLDSKVYIKYQLDVKEPYIPNNFSADFTFGVGQHLAASHIHIESEMPFYIQSHDTERLLNIKQVDVKQADAKHNVKQTDKKQGESNHEKKQIIDIVLKKPVIKLPVDETYMAQNGHLYPWVTVSSEKNWEDFAKLQNNRLEAVVSQKLPPLLLKIAEQAKTKTTLIDKINTITSQLAENVTYMGDWRTVKGALVPRNLEEIANSKYGDCKDFSAATIAILRHLGETAHFAFVYRGVDMIESPNNLPNQSLFNHAILRVLDRGEDNKTNNNTPKNLWIDPTNFTSYAQGMYPDIADRFALVFNPIKAEYIRTKALNPEDAELNYKKSISFPENVVHVNGEVKIKGALALSYIGADLRASKETINRAIINAVSDESRTLEWRVEDYNLTSRIVHDLNFKYSISEKNNRVKTTAGYAYMLSENLSPLLAKTKDRVTDLRLESTPSIFKGELLIKKASLVGNELKACSIDSPWVKATRNIQDTKEGIKVVDEAIIKKTKILNSELKTKEYAEFQDKVYHCFGEAALVYKNN